AELASTAPSAATAANESDCSAATIAAAATRTPAPRSSTRPSTGRVLLTQVDPAIASTATPSAAKLVCAAGNPAAALAANARPPTAARAAPVEMAAARVFLAKIAAVPKTTPSTASSTIVVAVTSRA